MHLALALCLVAAGGSLLGPSAPAEGRARGERAALRIVGAVVDVDVDGVDAAAVQGALGLRLPSLRRYDREHGVPIEDAPGLYAYIAVRRGDARAIAVRVILSDGRAYLRSIDAGDAEAPRLIASTLASLIPGIEEATEEPDEEDVTFPPALRADPLPLEAMPAPEPAAPDPRAAAEPSTAIEPAPRTTSAEPEPAPAPALSRVQVGPSAGVGGLVGFMTPAAGWRGAVGHVGLDLRGRAPERPWITGVELRFGSLAAADLRVQRLRVAALAGYDLRAGAVEVPIVAVLSVEPWWFGQVSSAMSPKTASGDGPRPLLGAALRATPSYTAALGPGGRTSLRLGVRFEIGAAGEPRRGLRAPILREGPAGASITGLGGPELGFGLDLTLWLTPRARRRSRAPSGGARPARAPAGG